MAEWKKKTIEYLKRRIEELETAVLVAEQQIHSDARSILRFQTATKLGRKKLAALKRQLTAYKKVLRDSEPSEEEE